MYHNFNLEHKMSRKLIKPKYIQNESKLILMDDDDLKTYVGGLFNEIASIKDAIKEDEELEALKRQYTVLLEEKYKNRLTEMKSKLTIARGVLKLKQVTWSLKEIDDALERVDTTNF